MDITHLLYRSQLIENNYEKLIELLRSEAFLDEETRYFIADALEGKFVKPVGRPKKNYIMRRIHGFSNPKQVSAYRVWRVLERWKRATNNRRKFVLPSGSKISVRDEAIRREIDRTHKYQGITVTYDQVDNILRHPKKRAFNFNN